MDKQKVVPQQEDEESSSKKLLQQSERDSDLKEITDDKNSQQQQNEKQIEFPILVDTEQAHQQQQQNKPNKQKLVRIKFEIDNIKISSDRQLLVNKAKKHSKFEFSKQKLEQQDQRILEYIDILVENQNKDYQLPQRELDENYEDILNHYKVEIEKPDELTKRPYYKLRVVMYDPSKTPDQEMSLQHFINEYQNYFVKLGFDTVIDKVQYLIFPLKKNIIRISFDLNSSLLFAGFILSFLEFDNYTASDEDNLDVLLFRVQYQKQKTYEDLKRFFKVLSTGNVLFEQLRKIKLIIEKHKHLKSKIKEIKQQFSENIRKNSGELKLLNNNNSNDNNNNNNNLNIYAVSLKSQKDSLLDKEEFQDIKQEAKTYFKCKSLVKKIYRQLCTQRLIDNFKTDLQIDQKYKEKEGDTDSENEDNNKITNKQSSTESQYNKQNKQQSTTQQQKSEYDQIQEIELGIQEYVKAGHCMVQISKRHLLMCQNQRLYEDMRKSKIKKQYNQENNLPNFEDYNMVSIFTITRSKKFVDDILFSSINFLREFFKVAFLIFMWTFIGIFIPFKVLFYKIEDINQYFNPSSDIKNKKELIPLILQHVLKAFHTQVFLAGSLGFIILNISKYDDLEFESKSLVILCLVYWIYQLFIQAILLIAQLVEDYFTLLNAFTEDMYDINQYNVAQQTYYIEFLESIEDTYMKNIIPSIPSNIEIIKKMGFVIGKSLMKSASIKGFGKKWISVQMLSSRYIYEIEPIASKDPYNIVEKVYDFSRPSGVAQIISDSFIIILIGVRALAIPILLTLYKDGYDEITILFMIVLQSILLYSQNIWPSGFKILESQKEKLRYLNRVINLITMKEVKGFPREVPIINIFDITSLESWHNLARITYAKSRRVDVIKDIAITLHGFVILLMLAVIILDLFDVFKTEQQLTHSLKFILVFIIDVLIILFIAIRSLWFKVQLNKTYDIIIEELEEVIGMVTDMTRNMTEMLYNIEHDDINYQEDEDVLLGDAGDDSEAVQDLLFKVGIYELKRNARIRLILKGYREDQEIDTEENRQELIHETIKYSSDLLKKYSQVKEEFVHESIDKAEMFLGLVKVDEKLVKQIIIAGLIAGVSSGMQIIITWLQSQRS